jgi:DNA-binding protein Fis
MDAQKSGNDNMVNNRDMIDEYFFTSASSRVYDDIINDIENRVITKALEISYGNQLAAARMLGLHRNTLKNKIKKYSIDVGDFKK